MPDSASPSEIALLLTAVHRLEERIIGQEQRLDQLLQATRLAHDDDRGMREALRGARAAPDYEASFEDPDPLVSILIGTWNNVQGLTEHSLPSALAQTHRNVEVVVVGDAAPAQVEAAVRVRFVNTTVRGPYEPDPRTAWLASGTPPFNLAARLARGRWIAPLGDDDELAPDHVERLLAHARAEHLEFVYGRFRVSARGRPAEVKGVFPPELGQIALQAALYHQGLRCFELELGDAIFETPNDWGLVRRMLRAGVRFGMIDAVVAEYFPSMRHELPRAGRPPVEGDVVTDLLARVAELERRLADA